jgi:hypothetical protein
MQTQVNYEWCIEFYTDDEFQDIADLNFSNADKLEFDESDFDAPDGQQARLCLVRKEGNEADGETDRWYAYVEHGELPKNFTDSFGYEVNIPIPQKYHKQLYSYRYKNLVSWAR